ncbi:MAG: hypothetical protein JWM33_228 [Caulobacteraceae bacterium]|nr:hypothetical protein [Caulobacteraceae bacterium]
MPGQPAVHRWSEVRVGTRPSSTLALAFTPLLAILMLGGTLAALRLGAASPGRPPIDLGVILVMGATLLAAHGLHLWLIDRTVR